MSCIICTESFTAQIRKEINCSTCKNSCCMCCFKTYHLSGEFKCMHSECTKQYTFNEICSTVNKKAFTNKLCQVIAEKEFSKEQKKLSQFKEITELETQRKTINQDIKNINQQIKTLKWDIARLREAYASKIGKLNREKYKLYKKQSENYKQTVILSSENYKQPVYKIYCGHKDCDSLLSRDFVCIGCQKQTCDKCYKGITGPDHVCTKEDLETVEKINQESVQCPECGLHISKTSGCDQMYCLKSSGGCGTVFSYKTGLIDKSRVHNPHALEERKEQLQANDCFDYFDHTDSYMWRREFKTGGMDDKFIRSFLHAWVNCSGLQITINRTKYICNNRKVKKGKNFITHLDEVKWFSQFKSVYKQNQFDYTVIETLERILSLLKIHVENFIENYKEKINDLTWINIAQEQLYELAEESFAELRSKLKHYGFRNVDYFKSSNYVQLLNT